MLEHAIICGILLIFAAIFTYQFAICMAKKTDHGSIKYSKGYVTAMFICGAVICATCIWMIIGDLMGI